MEPPARSPLRVALSPGGEVPTSFPISDGSGTDCVWAHVGLGPHGQLGVFSGAHRISG